MSTFLERLQAAALREGVMPTQAEMAKSLGLNRQTVYRWWHGTTPEMSMITRIAIQWSVSPTWLLTGQGPMVPIPPTADLSREEKDIIRIYRTAQPTKKRAMYDVLKVMGKGLAGLALMGAFYFPREVEASPDPRPFDIIKITLSARVIHIVSLLLSKVMSFFVRTGPEAFTFLT